MTIPDLINARFAELSEEKFRKFNAALIPNISNVLGIRMPAMRQLVKEIIVRPDWQEWLSEAEDTYMEHVMLQGLVIAAAKVEPAERFEMLQRFVPQIDNWAVCDSVVTSLKFIKHQKTEMLAFIEPYFASDREYELRFALVVLLAYYVEETYLPLIFDLATRTTHEAYYVRMAVAWLISVCGAKYPDATYAYLAQCTLPVWTHNKSIQKCIESYRIAPEMKDALRALRRK